MPTLAACLALTTALAALITLSLSHRARNWIFAALWQLGGAAQLDAKLRAAKLALMADHPVRGRVLDVGSGEGVNLKYLAAAPVTEIVCVEPNPYFHRKLRATARATVEARRASKGPPLSIRIFAGTLREFADEENFVLFDAVVCFLVLCSVGHLDSELDAAVRLLKPSGALYYIEHVGGQGTILRSLQHVMQPAWNLIGDGCQLCRDTGVALAKQAGLTGERQPERRLSLLAGLLPVICGVCHAKKPDAVSERAARWQRRERARSPVRRKGRHWEVTSNRNVVVVVER